MVNQTAGNNQGKKREKYRTIVNKPIREEFSLKQATIYGGYNLFSDSVAGFGLDRLLEQELSGMKAPQAVYDMPIVCRLLIGGYALGLPNIYQFEEIEHDPLITAKHSLEKLPDQTVMRKDLINKFRSDEDVNRLRRVKVRQVKKVLERLEGNLVLEYDSTVETGYGSQEGLAVGYNPHKHGRASYHPQLCREGKTGLSIWSRLRPGDTVSSSDFTEFLAETWQIIPKRFKRRKRKKLGKVVSRMDSGYECDEALKWLEAQGVGYVVKMTMRGDIWPTIFTIGSSHYRKIQTEAGEIEVYSFAYQRKGWKRKRRVVVIRWQMETNRAQTSLFDAMDYDYSIFVTNLKWREEDIYRFYDKRADVENHIREAKNDFCIDHISTDNFHANAADLELRLLAFNQMLLFTTQILQERIPRHYASTVRRKWLMVPAQMVKRGGYQILKLCEQHTYGDQWQRYRANIALA